MAGLFGVKFSGMEAIYRALNGLTSLSSDQRYDLMRSMARAVVRQTRERIISTKTSPDGAAWPARTRSYSWPLMVKTGKMAGSVKASISGTSAQVRIMVDYYGYHHTGTRKMAARPSLGLNEANVDELCRICDAWIARRMAA
ncbi:phage virion morphogenesis protein [Phreatobacter sp. HK31-P]